MAAYDEFFSNLFGVRLSVRYHQRRRAFFEGIHTVIATLQIVAGSSAFAAVFGKSEILAASFAATAALLAAFDLVFGTARRTTMHVRLGQQFSQLEREMVAFENDRDVLPDRTLAFQQRRIEIEEREPPKLRIISLLCHNELVEGHEIYDHTPIYPIGWVRRWIGHFVDIEVASILAKPTKRQQPQLVPANS
ncbi:MAG: hypothetical protein OXM56_11105 [Gammaproteobacteria bacterium]|nr:hypothetical protein [Gammaproteobacteria bacterium]